MHYEITAIETVFDSVTYRSRLEARWAAFFKRLGWSFEYEPRDFKGWIPDFALLGKKEITYVEVKPIARFDWDLAKKIEASGVDADVLICGLQGPPIAPEFALDTCDGRYLPSYPILGWMGEYCPESESKELWWENACLGSWKNAAPCIGFCHGGGSFHDRISGEYDGGCYGDGMPESDVYLIVRSAWAGACADVRYVAR